MTTLLSWISYSDTGEAAHLPRAVYLASDSRITWGTADHRWEAGRKVFAAASEPHIFGYCGDVVLPALMLGQAHLSERGFSTPAQRREAEANRFAAGILMPKPWFERDADRLGLPEVGHLRKLARSYDVSLEAAANRFVELTSTPCAVVFSHDGLVRYARCHVSFPRLIVERKSRLPSDCATKVRPNAGIAAPSDWIEMDGTIWLQHEWGRPSPRVLEQVLRQANGHVVTMLLLADDPTDAENEDEDDVVARWNPRF